MALCRGEHIKPRHPKSFVAKHNFNMIYTIAVSAGENILDRYGVFFMFGSTKLQNIFDMRRFFGKERRPSTIIRDNMVHTAYEEVCNEIGEYVHLVPRQFIYEKVRERTGLCLKTIAYILNHTVKQNLTIGGGNF